MTHAAVAAPTPATSTSDAPASVARAWSAVVANRTLLVVGADLGWWLVMATRLWGGRQSGAVTVGALLTALALLAADAGGVLSRRVTVAAVTVSAASFVVAATAPTGWAGAPVAAGYTCAALTVLVVAAAATRDPRVAPLAVGVVLLAGCVEFVEAWLPWWGGEQPTAPMIGTFYWHDPFAIFLLPPAALGVAWWLRRRDSLAAIGLLASVMAVVGIVHSTSRAAGACAALAIVLVAVSTVVERGRRALPRLAVATALTAGITLLVSGPPFFPHRATPFAATQTRAAGQSLGQNGGYRLDFWREALAVFRRHPLGGGGFHSLATESVGHTPAGWPVSPMAHSGYLQALSDGGLLLAVPFLLAAAAVAWLAVRSLVTTCRTRRFTTTGFVVPLCLLALLAHSAVDFDWSYPADFVLTAVLAGLVVAQHPRRQPAGPESRRRSTAAALLAATLAGAGLAAWTAAPGDLRLNLPVNHITEGTR